MKQLCALFICLMFVVACGPSEEEIATQTASAATSIAALWTATPTATPANTITPTPTNTLTPAPTNTPIPTPTNTPTATPTPKPRPKPGKWAGKVVSFIVTEDETIAELRFDNFTCVGTSSEELTIDTDDSFAFNPEGYFIGSSAETGSDLRIEGKFDSETTINGTYGLQLCAGFMAINQTNVAWSAEWQEP